MELYFHGYPVSWWNRFSDVADVQILSWGSFISRHLKLLVPNNEIGRKILDKLFYLEDRFPKLFPKCFQYPMIILGRRPVE